MSLRVLTVGTNPNLAFYAWRLYESRCQVTMVNPLLRNSTITFDSDTLGSNSFQPTVVSSFTKLSGRYDVVILSGSSLQDFQSLNSKIHSFINDDSLLIIESSGYINLEPFMTLKNPTLSIMNEAEIKQSTTSNGFIHAIKNKDFRIYLGATTTHQDATAIKSNRNFQAFYDLLNNWSNLKQINFLTSLNPKEFLTYQWKLALPKIVFAPLSIIFECEFPENLQSQILCKPLISGIIQELFKIIKKMDCKLVKGYENEANLLNNWINSYPTTKPNHHYINSPPLLYNFLNNFDLEIDLLLLQPILLADDYNIKSPYLENLYSTLCQFLKINNHESKFFTRLNLQENGKKIHEDTKVKNEELSALIKNIAKNKILNNQLNDDITNQESKVFKLNDDMEEKQAKLDGYNSLLLEKESELRHLDELISNNNDTLETTKQKSMDSNPQDFAEFEQQLNDKEQALKKREQELVDREQALLENNSSIRNVQPQLYVDTNGPRSQQAQGAPQSQQRDLQLNQQQQQQYNNQYNNNNNNQFNNNQQYNNQQYNNQPYNNQLPNNHGPGNQVPNQQQFNQKFPNQQQHPHQQFNTSQPQHYPSQQNLQQPFQQPQVQQQPNGYYPSPVDQLPPHGLPHNGLPQNALPPNLRGTNSMPGGGNRYQQLQVQPNQQPNQRQQQQPQRISSIPSMSSISEPHYNHPSFNNAAPIDPMIGQRFKNKPKQQNRRSAFPQMSGNLDGLDMGGRGGMPMPNVNKNRASTGNLLNNTAYASPPLGAQKKNMSNGNLNNQFQGMNMNQGQNDETQNNSHHQHGQPVSSGSGSSNSNASFGQHLAPPSNNSSYGQHLAPPVINGVSTASTSSTNTDDSPKTSTDTNNQAPISFNDAGAKPLGAGLGNAPTTNKKKKKKGIFGRSKE